MTRRILALVAVLALGVTGVAAAAHKPKGKPDHGAIHAHIIATHGKTAIIAGDFRDTVIGRGAVLYRLKVAPDSSGAARLTARLTIFTRKGTLSGHLTALQSVTPAGTAIVRGGRYKLAHGTGADKGRKATGRLHGTQAADGTYTLKFKGRIRK